ncbi:MAG: tetratricopeptide repeat protein [Pacificimonas sp.]
MKTISKKIIRTIALGAALSLAIPATGAMAQALSRDVGVPLQQANSLLRQGNTGAALSQVNRARAAANTANERRKVAQMSAAIKTARRDYSGAAADLESIGAPASQLMGLYYNAGNFDKAIQLGQRVGGERGITVVAQSYLKQGKTAEAAKIYEDLIARNGPQVKLLENLANAQYKMDDTPAYLATIERLIRQDPQPSRWRALLNNLKADVTSRDAKLALYKLISETDNVARPEDYIEFAKLATVAQEAGVAKSITEKGIADEALADEDPQVSRLLQTATQREEQAIAAFPTLKQGPEGYFRAGNLFYGNGNYKAAAVAYWRSYQLQKDIRSAPYANQALIGLGISALRAGNTDIAKKAFSLVEEDSAFNEVAALWTLYADTRTS